MVKILENSVLHTNSFIILKILHIIMLVDCTGINKHLYTDRLREKQVNRTIASSSKVQPVL